MSNWFIMWHELRPSARLQALASLLTGVPVPGGRASYLKRVPPVIATQGPERQPRE